MPIAHKKGSFLKGALFSSTALVLMMSEAEATPFTETSCPGSDAGNSIGVACDVPFGTTSVSGTVDQGEGDEEDWFKYSNLVPGSVFEVFGTLLDGELAVEVRDQSGALQFQLFSTGSSNSFVLGAGETMAFVVGFDEGEAGPYSAAVTATQAPEPASAALLGVGAAGLAGLRRRRKRG